MTRISRDEVGSLAARRLAAHRLVGEPFASITEAVRALVAVQSQDPAGAGWGLGQRVAGCTGVDVRAALLRGELLRTHVLRPTWHFVLPEDIRWLLELTGPRVVAGMAGRYRNLELDGATITRAGDVIGRELSGERHRTRGELGLALGAAGIEAAGSRLAHIVMHAELTGLVCSGPPRGQQHTYALLDECVPPAARLERDEALARLATRFAVAHGPFRDVDLAWWGGITLGDARRGLAASSLAQETIGDHVQWTGREASVVVRGPVVHLLPNFDEYVVAYRDRAHVFAQDVVATKGFVHDYLSRHLIVHDGYAVGRWLAPTGQRSDVQLELFSGVGVPDDLLHDQVERYTAFVR